MLYTRLNKLKSRNNYQSIITGLSYSLRGIVEGDLNIKTLKCALPSQDLYYDYLILKDILESGKKINNCILGLAYYSFDWDLSLTNHESTRILNVYYPIFKDAHNLKLKGDYSFKGIESIQENIEPIFLTLFKEEVFNFYLEDVLGINLTPDFAEQLWEQGTYLKGKSIKSFEEIERYNLGMERAKFHNKINYPSTRTENKLIMIKILELLRKFSVSPILVIFPTTKYYYENFNYDIRDRFYEIMTELSNQHKFKLIDLFKSDVFEDEDFVDWDHLNKRGAFKMTEILNKNIRF